MYDPLRRLYPIKATVLKDVEEKVVVEETFQPKSFPDNEVRDSSEEALGSSSSGMLERWVIKVEQSVNLFLTVSVYSYNHFFVPEYRKT